MTLNLTVNHSNSGDTTAVACDSFTWYGTTYTSTPAVAPMHVFSNIAGCDSTVTLNLTVNHSNTGDTTAMACGSFDWYEHTGITASTETLTHVFSNITYTVSGDYTYSHLDNNGCTQVDTLHLTIGNRVVVKDTVATCDSYEWNGRMYTESGDYTFDTTTVNGCDSIVLLNLTINHSADTTISMMHKGSIEWNGMTYSESGTYERILTTVTGCDSVVTLNLVILPEDFVMPYLYNLMDVMLSVNHNEEGMENVHYIYYRWYRDGELVLEGPNYDSYSEGGNRLNGCYYLEVAVDESMQYWVRSNEVCIGTTGIEEAENIDFTIAPNPVMHGSMVNVSVDGADMQGAEIRVYDLQGRMLVLQKDSGIIEAPQASGMYMVRLTLSDGRTAVKRLIVK